MPLDGESVANILQTNIDATERLMNACVGLGFLEKEIDIHGAGMDLSIYFPMSQVALNGNTNDNLLYCILVFMCAPKCGLPSGFVWHY